MAGKSLVYRFIKSVILVGLFSLSLSEIISKVVILDWTLGVGILFAVLGFIYDDELFKGM